MKTNELKGLNVFNSVIHMQGPSRKAARVNADLESLHEIGLRKWLLARNVMQKDFARQMCLSEAVISQICNDKRNLRAAHLISIRGLLNEGRI